MHPLLSLLLSLPPTLVIPLALLTFSLLFSLTLFILYLLLTLYSTLLLSSNLDRRAALLAQLNINEKATKRKLIGFFHPYCNAGGGGERVLWTAIAYLQRTEPETVMIVYTGDLEEGKVIEKGKIIASVQSRFGIVLEGKSLILVGLKSRFLVEDGYWRRFTLLGQSLGSVWMALEGLRKGVVPDIWIDTMGYAFAYPLVSVLTGVPVGSYTHYPTISTDMLERVASMQEGHTNQSIVAKSIILTSFKLIYYNLFAELYSLSLRRADVLMVNSSWTKGHIDRLLRPFGYRDDAAEVDEVPIEPTVVIEPVIDGLRQRKSTKEPGNVVQVVKKGKKFNVSTIVYPPCDTLAFSTLSLESRQNTILSVAQFRPEKEHATQLRALRILFDTHPQLEVGNEKWKLIMAGSVRNGGDEARVESLKRLCAELKLTENVEFAINVPYPKLIELFGQASIGLHTMIDEHFGITVVEIMAAGLIPVVHASAGPLLDIVTPYPESTGFHSTSPESFAKNLAIVITEMDAEEIMEMRQRARLNAQERFSTENFEKGWEIGWRKMVERLN